LNEGEIVIQDTANHVFEQVKLLHEIGVRPPDGVELMAELRAAGLINPSSTLLDEDQIKSFLIECLSK